MPNPTSNPLRAQTGNHPWFALRVKPNHEKTVSEGLDYQGMEQFLPLYRVRKRWSQRWQNIDAPLFPGYVFSRFERQSWPTIMRIPGIIDAVRFGSTLAVVDDEEIGALQLLQNSKAGAQPSRYLWAGQSIRVTAGPLAGIKGTLVEVKGVTGLVLSITMLQRSVLVEIDHNWVTYDLIPQPGSISRSDLT